MKAAARSSRSLLGFTLVELIVVITILVILGTIAFVSLSWFSGSARDSSRVSDLSLIGKGLDIHYTKLWSFPVPTSSTGITFGSSSSVVWYQGTIGEWVIRSLGWAWARISTKPVDPLTKEEYRYSLPTGVNEYLLGADYEGDSVAWGENWEDSVIARLVRSNLGKNDRGSDHIKKEDFSWIASLRSQWLMHSFLSTNAESRGIFGLDLASASTGSPTLSYLKGTYNGVATRVSSGSTINIIALPSIFLSSGSTGTIVDASSRNFLLQGKSLSWVSFAPKVVYSSGALPSNDTERLLFSSGIVAAYSGTSLATNSDIKSFIDNVNSTGSLSAVGGNFVRNKFGGNGPSIVSSAVSSYAPYPISNSLRFNGTNQYLSRTPTSTGNQKKWTWSGWVKPVTSTSTTVGLHLLQVWADNNNRNYINLTNTDVLQIGSVTGWTATNWLVSSSVFRDPSAWYHILVNFDTTQTWATDRLKVYINGVPLSSFSTDNRSSIGQDSTWYVNSTVPHRIGTNAWVTNFWAGYLADVNLVDSWALDASAFWQTNPTTGQWEPKQYTGSYGANGSHLDFSNNINLGADTSGNLNNWMPNNFTNISGDVLLLHGDGANGSATFTDSSSWAQSATLGGSPTISTTQSEFGWASMYFNGSSYLSYPSSPDLEYGIWDFTIDWWVRFTSTSGTQLIWEQRGAWQTYIQIYITGGRWSLDLGNSIGAATSTYPNTGQWYHFALTRRAGIGYFFVDGNQLWSGTYTTNDTGFTTNQYLGFSSFGSFYLNGYIDEFRITKGIPRLIPGFTPPPSASTPTSWINTDQMIDTPTNNFATLNPLWTNTTLSEGNLRSQSSGGNSLAIATIPASATDDWYWEVTVRALSSTVAPGNSPGIGITNSPNHGLSTYLGGATSDYAIWQGGQIWYNGSAFATYTAPAVNDVLAFRLYNGSLYIGKVSGGVLTWMNGGAAIVTGLTGNWFPAATVNSWSDVQWNFWQKPWATSTLPGASKSLSTANLPAWSIVTSGSFTANNLADGPFVWTNGTPTTLSIGGNPVTWWNQADKLANGFKLRVNTAGYNDGAGTKNFTVTTGSGNVFKYANAQSN